MPSAKELEELKQLKQALVDEQIPKKSAQYSEWPLSPKDYAGSSPVAKSVEWIFSHRLSCAALALVLIGIVSVGLAVHMYEESPPANTANANDEIDVDPGSHVFVNGDQLGRRRNHPRPSEKSDAAPVTVDYSDEAAGRREQRAAMGHVATDTGENGDADDENDDADGNVDANADGDDGDRAGEMREVEEEFNGKSDDSSGSNQDTDGADEEPDMRVGEATYAPDTYQVISCKMIKGDACMSEWDGDPFKAGDQDECRAACEGRIAVKEPGLRQGFGCEFEVRSKTCGVTTGCEMPSKSTFIFGGKCA